MSQSDKFMDGEGDAWLRRNRNKLPRENDPVIYAIGSSGIKPKNILEIGCSNGWRLNKMKKLWGCNVCGIEPSMEAVEEANQSGLEVTQGTADNLDITFLFTTFDVIICGFFLYVTDPEDLFKIVSETDRLLEDRGYLVIHDFEPIAPYRTPYKHREGLWSYHMDHPALWLAHPWYSTVSSRTEANGTTVTILRKDVQAAFP